jgi:hypothetical protein
VVVSLEDLLGETVVVVVTGELPDDDGLVYEIRELLSVGVL